MVSARPFPSDSRAEEAGCGTAKLLLQRIVLGHPWASGDTDATLLVVTPIPGTRIPGSRFKSSHRP